MLRRGREEERVEVEVRGGALHASNTPIFNCWETLLEEEAVSVPMNKWPEESAVGKLPLDGFPTPEGSSGESKEDKTLRAGRRAGLKEEAVRSAAACSAGGAPLGARERAHPIASNSLKVAERRDGKKGRGRELC